MADQLEEELRKLLSPGTRQQERRQAEKNLLAFKTSNENHWGVTWAILDNSSNEYLLWFAASCLEYHVCWRWAGTDPESRKTMRRALVGYLGARRDVGKFVFNKVAQVLVLIAKLGWPEEYPEFFPDVQALLERPDTLLPGLALFRLAMEDFVSGKENVPSDRRARLAAGLAENAAGILEILERMSLWLVEAMRSAQRTPLQSACCAQLLQTAQQFFASVSLNRCAAEPSAVAAFHNVVTSALELALLPDEVGACALACVAELLQRAQVPPALLDAALPGIVNQLAVVMERFPSSPSPSDDYAEHVVQCVDSVLTRRVRRAGEVSGCRMDAFLGAFLKLTFRAGAEPDQYASCLSTWCSFLEFCGQAAEESLRLPGMPLGSLGGGFLALVTETAARASFRSNADFLEDIEDDDPSSDFGEITSSSVEIVAGVMAVCPGAALDVLNAGLASQADAVLALPGEAMAAGSPENGRVAKDLALTLRMYGAVALNMAAPNAFEERFNITYAIVDKVLQVGEALAKVQLRGRPDEYARLQAGIYSALRDYCPWLARYSGVRSDVPPFEAVLGRVVGLAAAALSGHVDVNVAEAAGSLLRALSGAVPPAHLLAQPPFALMCESIEAVCAPLAVPVQEQLYVSVAQALLRPPQQKGEQEQREWAARVAAFEAFVAPLCGSVAKIAEQCRAGGGTHRQDQVMCAMSRNSKIFAALAQGMAGAAREPRVVFHRCAAGAAEALLDMLSLYGEDAQPYVVLEHIMEALHRLLAGFRAQLGPAYLRRVLAALGRMFAERRMRRDELAYVMMEKFLGLATEVVDDNLSGAEDVLPGLLGIALTEVFQEFKAGVELAESLHEPFAAFMERLLFRHFRKFFAPAVGVARPGDGLLREYLGAVLETFTWALSQPDPDPFRAAVATLNSLERTNRLFGKEEFRATIRWEVVRGLFLALLLKTHDGLRDDMTQLVHGVVGDDTAVFVGQFLPQFLQGAAALPSDQQASLVAGFSTDRDYPTFQISVNRIINDFNFYSMIQGQQSGVGLG